MNTKIFAISILASSLWMACQNSGNKKIESNAATANQSKITSFRFFNDSSFWNLPIPENAQTDPRTAGWIKLLETEPETEEVKGKKNKIARLARSSFFIVCSFYLLGNKINKFKISGTCHRH